jgi:hypothetical protein
MERLPHGHRHGQNILAALEQRQRHDRKNLMPVGHPDAGVGTDFVAAPFVPIPVFAPAHPAADDEADITRQGAVLAIDFVHRAGPP